MSSKQKRKAKPKAQRREKPKQVRRRKVTEEKKREALREKKAERVAPEVPEKPLLLAVRLLGPFGTPMHIEIALKSLKLNHRYRAALLEKNESTLGTLRTVKDYITWGELASPVVANLLKQRAELSNGKDFNDKFVKDNFNQESMEALAHALARGQVRLNMLWQKGVQPVFRLRPPSGGFEASIKRPFGSRGELGYRGTDISSLVERMI